MKKNRIYADTSVFGGVFDAEFAAISQRFFDEVRNGLHTVLISEVTLRELKRAPLKIQQFLDDLPVHTVENLTITEEMAALSKAYIYSEVVSIKWIDDAVQVAAATVARADAIVSWNFRHMVKWEKVRAFNAVNMRLGYPVMTIITPREVISDEKII